MVKPIQFLLNHGQYTTIENGASRPVTILKICFVFSFVRDIIFMAFPFYYSLTMDRIMNWVIVAPLPELIAAYYLKPHRALR